MAYLKRSGIKLEYNAKAGDQICSYSIIFFFICAGEVSLQFIDNGIFIYFTTILGPSHYCGELIIHGWLTYRLMGDHIKVLYRMRVIYLTCSVISLHVLSKCSVTNHCLIFIEHMILIKILWDEISEHISQNSDNEFE